MYQVLLVIFLLVTLSLIILIILQQSKSNGIETSFNMGAYGNLFGSAGPNVFLTRVICILAVIFFILSLILTNLSSRCNQQNNNQWDQLNQNQQKLNKVLKVDLEKVDNDIPK